MSNTPLTTTDNLSGSCLYQGEVMHARQQPVEYAFRYGVFSLKADLDQIENQAANLRWLGFNRFNLVSFHQRDYGPRDGSNLRVWVDNFLAEYGVERPTRVEILSYPRILGYAFNPLVMWYAYDQQNQLSAVIAEVSNTFGQWHHYIAKVPPGLVVTPNQTLKAEADKVFHVSPFIDMNARYHFRLQLPAQHYSIHIRETRQQIEFFQAGQSGKYLPLTNQNLLKMAGMAPLRMFKVIGLIHWWALKILLKGGKFHRTPKSLENIRYSHSEMQLCL